MQLAAQQQLYPQRASPFLQILTSRPRQEWMADVAARYRALSQFSKDDARVQVGFGAGMKCPAAGCQLGCLG